MRNLTLRLQGRGIESISDEEILALLLADEEVDEQVIQLAERLLSDVEGSLQSLATVELARLRMVAGLGMSRAMRLRAAVELGRRIAIAETQSMERVASDGDVVRIMEPVVGTLQHEECWVLYLASSGRVLDKVRISQGGVQSTVVDCRLIIKRALELLAVQLVLVHNHPSGSASPSDADCELTERVAEAAKLFEIRLLDHVIIARGEHFSFRGHNLLK